MNHRKRWIDFQREKKADRRKKIIKEVLIGVAVAVIMLLAMGIAGQTYPY